jgi:hypothetical protein
MITIATNLLTREKVVLLLMPNHCVNTLRFIMYTEAIQRGGGLLHSDHIHLDAFAT